MAQTRRNDGAENGNGVIVRVQGNRNSRAVVQGGSTPGVNAEQSELQIAETFLRRLRRVRNARTENTPVVVSTAGQQSWNVSVIEEDEVEAMGQVGGSRGAAISQRQDTARTQQQATTTTSVSNPNLRNKLVYALDCALCRVRVCKRAMRAILLADVKVELYSTDIPPPQICLQSEDRQTQGCRCRIRDTVCATCGQVLGYHVSQPCERCLGGKNNGHFWMFYAEAVGAESRKVDGEADLYWSALQPMLAEEDEHPNASTLVACR